MDWLSLFKNYLVAERRYSPHTSDAYISDIQQFECFLNQTYSLQFSNELSHMHVRSWLASMSSKGMQAKSIRRKISSLNTFYRYLKMRNLSQNNPVARVISPKLKKRLPLTVNESDLDFSLPADSDQEEDYKYNLSQILVQTLYALGIRRAELINLKMADLDQESRQIKVTGKGGKQRIIPFGDELRKNLIRYFRMRSELIIKDSEYVFLLPNGQKLYPKMVYLIVNKWLKERTSLSKRSPHLLRHSFATHLADHGADINAIKELMGHANLSATQIYTHNSIDQLRKTYIQAHPRASLK